MAKTQAELFRTFQSCIWDIDGPTYEVWENAIETLEVMGAKPTGDKKEHDGNLTWNEYLFPDGSLAEVLSDGSGVDDPVGECGGIYKQDGFGQSEDESED